MGKLEKIIIIILLVVLIVINSFIIFMFYMLSSKKDVSVPFVEENKGENKNNELFLDIKTGEYEVYQNDKYLKSFMNYDDAVEYAKKYENASVKRFNGDVWLWDNTPMYNVYLNSEDNVFTSFSDFKGAVDFSKQNGYADIYYRKNNSFVWNNHEELKKSNFINGVPIINQYPELKRGCEVTSLAMLLRYKGISVDKMTLAKNISRDTTPYKLENGLIYYGNPNNGFIGDIYSSENRGLGVYHKPIYALLTQYIGNKAIDLTGCDFDSLYYFIQKGCPIWIITNSKFNTLPSSEFEIWNTTEGQIKITYSEHSVLIIGYDENYIYINDPMNGMANVKKPKGQFIAAWEQMGRQAITICP